MSVYHGNVYRHHRIVTESMFRLPDDEELKIIEALDDYGHSRHFAFNREKYAIDLPVNVWMINEDSYTAHFVKEDGLHNVRIKCLLLN